MLTPRCKCQEITAWAGVIPRVSAIFFIFLFKSKLSGNGRWIGDELNLRKTQHLSDLTTTAKGRIRLYDQAIFFCPLFIC